MVMKRVLITYIFLAFAIVRMAALPNEQPAALLSGMTPEEMVAKLERQGLRMQLNLFYKKDTASLGCIMLSTFRNQAGRQREDYHKLMQWMRKHYGAPTWEASVRSHPFARWYLGRDSDIVVIATGASTVEAWFYANHDKRNVDYYSILKYCENNPVEGVPYLTAQQSITWRNTAPAAAKSKGKKAVRKHGRRVVHKKRASKSKKRRRRR